MGSRTRFSSDQMTLFIQGRIDSEFYFHEKFWVNLINLGYCIHSEHSHPLLQYSYCAFDLFFFFFFAWRITQKKSEELYLQIMQSTYVLIIVFFCFFFFLFFFVVVFFFFFVVVVFFFLSNIFTFPHCNVECKLCRIL